MGPATTKAKRTGPTGPASPRGLRRREASSGAATILPIGSGGGGDVGGGICPPARFLLLLGDVGGRCERSGLDLGREAVELCLDVSGQPAGEVVDGVTGSVVGDAERKRSALEVAGDDVLDRRVGGDVDLLERAGDDRRVGVLLVVVHADAVDLCLACRLQNTES